MTAGKLWIQTKGIVGSCLSFAANLPDELVVPINKRLPTCGVNAYVCPPCNDDSNPGTSPGFGKGKQDGLKMMGNTFSHVGMVLGNHAGFCKGIGYHQ